MCVCLYRLCNEPRSTRTKGGMRGGGGGERERERESVCVCVCVSSVLSHCRDSLLGHNETEQNRADLRPAVTDLVLVRLSSLFLKDLVSAPWDVLYLQKQKIQTCCMLYINVP